MIGQCGITMQEYKTAQVPEIGYLLAHKYWHKGYAVEAATACRIFSQAGLLFFRRYSRRTPHCESDGFTTSERTKRVGVDTRGNRNAESKILYQSRELENSFYAFF